MVTHQVAVAVRFKRLPMCLSKIGFDLMRQHIKILLLVVMAAVALSVGVYAYYLTMPRASLMVYPDSKVTGCKERLNETVILHLANSGNMDLHVNACAITIHVTDVNATYFFQSDIEIPVGVEAVTTFRASGGEVRVETVSGPSGAVASGGVYAVSDNPDPNPFFLGGQTELVIYSRSGIVVKGEATSPIALKE